jgi:hypothetical protein
MGFNWVFNGLMSDLFWTKWQRDRVFSEFVRVSRAILHSTVAPFPSVVLTGQHTVTSWVFRLGGRWGAHLWLERCWSQIEGPYVLVFRLGGRGVPICDWNFTGHRLRDLTFWSEGRSLNGTSWKTAKCNTYLMKKFIVAVICPHLALTSFNLTL